MNSKITILLIEDEASISKLISKLLTSQNYKVLSTSSAKDGLSIITSHCPDVVILDLGLPDMDGLDVLRQVRSWSSLPIIVVSARTQEKEKVLALDLGADDYISKPFGNAELLARVRTVIRHSNKLNTATPLYKRPYYAKGLKIDFEKHLVTVNDVPVHLTQIEFKIISLLAQNSGSVITYSNIISNIWGPYVDDNNRILRVNMANIRRKIEPTPSEPQYLFTEVGIGYRMLEDEQE